MKINHAGYVILTCNMLCETYLQDVGFFTKKCVEFAFSFFLHLSHVIVINSVFVIRHSFCCIVKDYW